MTNASQIGLLQVMRPCLIITSTSISVQRDLALERGPEKLRAEDCLTSSCRSPSVLCFGFTALVWDCHLFFLVESRDLIIRLNSEELRTDLTYNTPIFLRNLPLPTSGLSPFKTATTFWGHILAVLVHTSYFWSRLASSFVETFDGKSDVGLSPKSSWGNPRFWWYG